MNVRSTRSPRLKLNRDNRVKEVPMTHEIRHRVHRPATPDEKARHDQIRSEIEREAPELASWASSVVDQNVDRVRVGTVFTADEANIVKAIDDYAANHSLDNRGAVVRQALAKLLGIDVTSS